MWIANGRCDIADMVLEKFLGFVIADAPNLGREGAATRRRPHCAKLVAGKKIGRDASARRPARGVVAGFIRVIAA
jgi:hypothetical protein